MMGAYSDNLSQHQLFSDPGGLGSEILAGSLAVELEQLRFCIKRITGTTHWYQAASTTLNAGAADDAITNAKLANMAAGTYKMRVSSGSGDPEDATVAQATAGLNAFVGDSGSGGTKGLVPAPSAGDGALGKLLSANGTFRGPATQATMETATSVIDHVVPANQQHHPGHPKVWMKATVSGGVPSLAASYNVTSITDSGVGLLTVTIGTDFSSASWTACSTTERDTTNLSFSDIQIPQVRNAQQTAGSIMLEAVQINTGINTLSHHDPAAWHLSGFGDQ